MSEIVDEEVKEWLAKEKCGSYLDNVTPKIRLEDKKMENGKMAFDLFHLVIINSSGMMLDATQLRETPTEPKFALIFLQKFNIYGSNQSRFSLYRHSRLLAFFNPTLIW